MTPDEKELVELVFAHGVSALVDSGMDAAEVKKFTSRDDVQALLASLVSDYDRQSEGMERTRYVVRRAMARLGKNAMTVLRDALLGAEYVRDEQGNLITDDKGNPKIATFGPAEMQLEAARYILNNLGIKYDSETEANSRPPEVSLNILLQKIESQNVKINYGDKTMSEAEKTLARERMRNAIQRIFSKVKAGHKAVNDALTPPKRRRKKVQAIVKATG